MVVGTAGMKAPGAPSYWIGAASGREVWPGPGVAREGRGVNIPGQS